MINRQNNSSFGVCIDSLLMVTSFMLTCVLTLSYEDKSSPDNPSIPSFVPRSVNTTIHLRNSFVVSPGIVHLSYYYLTKEGVWGNIGSPQGGGVGEHWFPPKEGVWRNLGSPQGGGVGEHWFPPRRGCGGTLVPPKEGG